MLGAEMRRRDFIALLGSATTWPLAVHAQQSPQLPIIGLLGVDPAMWSAWTGAFANRLNDIGLIDGRKVKVEYRWAQGRPELYTQFAEEFARLNAKVIVTSDAAVPALMRAAPSIPIVFAAGGERLMTRR